MRQFCFGILALGLVGLVGGSAIADSSASLKGVHLCCGACVKGVAEAVKTVDGATAKCDQKGKTVTITAKDAATVRKAVDAVAAAGYHGEASSAEFAIADDSGAPKGKVTKVTVSGVHNCCRSCNNAVKAAVKEVSGVKADTAVSKATTFEVSGDFDAAELVKSLNAAGFHVKVK